MSRGDNPTDISRKQRDLRADTAERLEAIVEAAERAAQSVIDDAEAQARRYLAQARSEADQMAAGNAAELADLIDPLLGQARSLREEAERLQATLEAAQARIAGEDVPPNPSEPLREARPETSRLRAVEQAEPAAAEPEGRRVDPAGARLLATQMAVSGNSREEITQRLRNGFEIEDADSILDAILGPED